MGVCARFSRVDSPSMAYSGWWASFDKARIVASIVTGVVAIPTCAFGFWRLQPLVPYPTMYSKGDVATGPNDRDAPTQPMLRFKFGNTGSTTLFVNRIDLLVDGSPVSWKDVIPQPSPPITSASFELANSSDDLIGRTFTKPRRFAPGAFIELARIYPAQPPVKGASKQDAQAFLISARDHLRDRKVEYEVSYRALDHVVPNWWWLQWMNPELKFRDHLVAPKDEVKSKVENIGRKHSD